MIEEIIFEQVPGKEGDVGLITLNRQKVLNALNHKMFIAMDEQLLKWQTDSNIKGVIIRAVPGRAFCAGGDIRHVYEEGKRGAENLPRFFRDEYQMNCRIHYYPKPYIALLNGITMGGGVGISIHGTHRIATENLMFAMPETNIGFFPDIGASYFLSRLPYHIGFYLGLTGLRITAADCGEIGLTNFYVSPDSIEKIILSIAETPFENNANLIVSKMILAHSISAPAGSLIQYKNDIELCFNKNTVEEILQALDALSTEWGKQTAAIIRTKSPTSLKVTLQAMQKGKNLNFDECMQMEYRLANRFLQGHDFYEGVRATIIDKDQSPQWQPAQLEQVSFDEVSKYFAPLDPSHELSATAYF